MERFPSYRVGFLAYYDAAVEPDPMLRSQYVLAGNLLITDYEQQRLQQYVEIAFFVEPRDWRSVRGVMRIALGRAIAKVTTRRVTAIITPEFLIPVGRPLETAVPAELKTAAVPLLQVALTRYPSSAVPCCTNWANYEDRMQFICALFTRLHFEPSVHGAPFTLAATSELRRALLHPNRNPAEGINRESCLE